MAIAGSSSWLNAFAVSMATPPMLESLKFGTYILCVCLTALADLSMSDTPDSFGAWCFVAAAFCVFIPETAGRSLEVCDFVYLSAYEPSVNIDSLPVGYGRRVRRHE